MPPTCDRHYIEWKVFVIVSSMVQYLNIKTNQPSGHTIFKQHFCNVAVQCCLNVTFWFQNWTLFNITVMFPL